MGMVFELACSELVLGHGRRACAEPHLTAKCCEMGALVCGRIGCSVALPRCPSVGDE
jgi:hypothetical protein